MSNGPFVTRIYESNEGTFHSIKQQPESAAFSVGATPNATSPGPVDSKFWAKTSRGAKEYGLLPRKLRFQFDAGTAPDDYEECGTLEIVIYRKSVYDAAVLEGTATYLGAAGKIKGRSPENIYPGT